MISNVHWPVKKISNFEKGHVGNFRPHRSVFLHTVWRDRSVCFCMCLLELLTFVSLAKTAEPIEMPYGVAEWGGYKNMYYIGMQIPNGKGQIFGRKWRSMVKYRDTLYRELCKNGWTGRDTIWCKDSGDPKKSCIRWGPDLLWEGALLKGVRPIRSCYRATLC